VTIGLIYVLKMNSFEFMDRGLCKFNRGNKENFAPFAFVTIIFLKWEEKLKFL